MQADLAAFIATHIRSLEGLEILMLLSRSAGTYWSVDAISNRLGIAHQVASESIDGMLRRKLVVEGSTGAVFRFNSDDEWVLANVEELRRAYRDRLVDVINALYDREASGFSSVILSRRDGEGSRSA